MRSSYPLLKPVLLVAIVLSQAFFLVNMHRAHSIYGSLDHADDWLKHPARKEFRVDVRQMGNHTIFDYTESFDRQDEVYSCGMVYVQRWHPLLFPDEEYTSTLWDDKRQTTSRDFTSLGEAEQWLFSNGCPSTTWGRWK